MNPAQAFRMVEQALCDCLLSRRDHAELQQCMDVIGNALAERDDLLSQEGGKELPKEPKED